MVFALEVVGRDIVQRQREAGWGKSVVEQLARDLQKEMPGVSGFSSINIWRMRAFYLAWTAEVQFLSQAVTEIDGSSLPSVLEGLPWGHNLELLFKLKEPTDRIWYAHKAVEHGWSRNVMVHQIETRLKDRQGSAPTNFHQTLPAPQSDLAQQVIKDPFCIEFLTLAPDAKERDLEQGLMDHVQKFLLELGAGFAFYGRQVHLEVGGQDFYIDLLFYHVRLHCFVVIELKAGEFRPGDAGQLNFYLAVVDDIMKQPGDNPTIGILLCKQHNRVVAEYALRGMSQPMGVAQWRTKELDGLPSVEQLEAGLSGENSGEDDLG